MKRVVALVLATVAVQAEDIPETPTIPIVVNVEVVDYQKVCNKAMAVLVARHKITTQQAYEYILIDGDVALRQEKCLEVIFTDASSPTNGYRVHVVSSTP